MLLETQAGLYSRSPVNKQAKRNKNELKGITCLFVFVPTVGNDGRRGIYHVIKQAHNYQSVLYVGNKHPCSIISHWRNLHFRYGHDWITWLIRQFVIFAIP